MLLGNNSRQKTYTSPIKRRLAASAAVINVGLIGSQYLRGPYMCSSVQYCRTAIPMTRSGRLSAAVKYCTLSEQTCSGHFSATFSPLFSHRFTVSFKMYNSKNGSTAWRLFWRNKKVSIISANKICHFYSALVFCLQCSIYNMVTRDRTIKDFIYIFLKKK